MKFDHDHVRRVVEEDRLSSLPDELIHKILSHCDMKISVQTCLLSSRWKLLWTSMPYLNFSSRKFRGDLSTFAEFVTHVLSHRNHQSQVYSVNLYFHGQVNEEFVKKIANYAFSHNVQELTIDSFLVVGPHFYPPCLFSSQSLKLFTFFNHCNSTCVTPTTPWDFPSLTTLHLFSIGLGGDLFSKCVNLTNLKLKHCYVNGGEAFDIITPRLSNLTLIRSNIYSKVLNIIAPQLENLTITNCTIKSLNAPRGLTSLCYRGCHPPPLSKYGFYSLNKVNICLATYFPNMLTEEYACKTINMLQEIRSVRYLTLHVNIVECISSFPDLLSHHSSSFSNLICLTIDSSMKESSYKVKMSTEARNFFTLIMDGC